MNGATSQTINTRPPIPAGTQQGTAKTPCCGLCNSAVTSPTFTRQSLRVSLSAVTGTPLSSVMEKINSSGTEDGERLIIELMITSHSHEFTQIMQMKSFHE